MDERQFWLEQRKGLLIQLHAIEKRHPSTTVTVTIKREIAEKLGLINSQQN